MAEVTTALIKELRDATNAGILDARTSQLDAVETIERSSIDFYATTRNLYRQSRNAKINEGKISPTDDLPNL